jgi:hypothetical protein
VKAAGRLLAAVAVAVASLWCVAAWLGLTLDDFRHFGEAHNLVRIDGEEVRIPEPDGPATRLLPEVPVTTHGAYAFMFEDDGEPVRYDPCRPLEWVLNTDAMPDGVGRLVRQAVSSVQDATGLQFEYEGTTTETASFDRKLIQSRYEGGFAPIIIGFATEQTEPQLEGAVTGIGGSSAVFEAYGDEQFLHSGVVILDSDDIGNLMGSKGGKALVRAVIEHELGHVVGLAHVDDPDELMNASNTAVTQWGQGDLAGLAIAGSGPCEDD